VKKKGKQEKENKKIRVGAPSQYQCLADDPGFQKCWILSPKNHLLLNRMQSKLLGLICQF
jgi:hypothetical protein